MVEIDILAECKHSYIVGLYEAFFYDQALWVSDCANDPFSTSTELAGWCGSNCTCGYKLLPKTAVASLVPGSPPAQQEDKALRDIDLLSHSLFIPLPLAHQAIHV